ncbi:60S ribosomal protein L30 [Myotis davidii]|uniref:60S ribosomal protein L30 n=1 Tax=Myotis davidii TaxID=225400 RepID=L5M7V9_MYODS|nr:60S ribosomal protein L30 [Myotis davidii]
MVAAKKMKKSLELVNSRLQRVMKCGKFVAGDKQMTMVRQGPVKLVVLASTHPALRKCKTGHHTTLARAAAHHYRDNGAELAAVCGKY